MNFFGGRESAITQMAGSDEWVAALRAHIHEILEGEAFKGSHRSGQFLSYIVDQAVSGHFELLKERMIGIELFGRPPSYDTSEDAIVRVTASDVRKRLLQHYGKYGTVSEFRVTLPLGSYVPEIIHEPRSKTGRLAAGMEQPEPAENSTASPRQPVSQLLAVAAAEVAGTHSGVSDQIAGVDRARSHRWLYFAALLVFLNLALWGLLWRHSSRAGTAAQPAVLPWSILFNSAHATHLITSDPDIFSIQILTHRLITVSDYANRHFLPDDNTVSPELKLICEQILSGDKASNVDAQIAAEVAAVARTYSRTIEVQGARSLEFANLKTDDNFIFLGSPSSDPWFSVFEDQLDFQFVSAPVPGGGLIRDVRPRASEQAIYVPTARGGATGESFAVVALVGNPDQSGQVLLLAGLNREGTQAAGNLATDPVRLSMALRNCGIASRGPLRHFEMLLRVHTMAGSPSQFDVVTCHILPGGSS
jgi:hypothetical protein